MSSGAKENDPQMRKCPHGINVGPLDDYGVPEGDRVFSTYCAECSHDQTGLYPWWDEAAAYEWPLGYHPRTLDCAEGTGTSDAE